MKTIILTGGGTAGHIIPNLALIPTLKKFFDKIYYVGSTPMEEKLVKNANIPYHKITSVKLDRSKIFSNLKIPLLLKKGIKEASELLNSLSPDVIFSKGGYVALPICFAAKKAKIPIVCHESDYSLGLANKLVSKFSKKTLTSFPETLGGIYTGNPVRKEIYNCPKCSLPSCFNPTFKTILIFGGSLGSVAINSAIYDLLPILTKNYNIIHISGNNGNFNIAFPNYLQFKYTDNLPQYLNLCDLVICRSGSNTLFECSALGKRCITIPLPKGASRGDQILNARSFEKQGCCKVLTQEELSSDKLLQLIDSIWNFSPKKINVEKINQKIVDEIITCF